VRIVTIDTSKEKEDRKPLVLLDPEIVWGQQPVGLLLHGLAVEGAEADPHPVGPDHLGIVIG
jgi:hypothetical protein